MHSYNPSQIEFLMVIILSCFLFRISWIVTKNLVFSPLRQYPGPKLAALTKWWDVYHTIKRDKFKVVHELHRKHGPVVRVGPNHVSFSSPTTFRQVYVKECSTFLKEHEFYSNIQPGIGPKYSGLFNFTNHQQALNERKSLQNKLSPSALRQYEQRFLPIVDRLIDVIKSKGELDLFAYFKFLMLDAIGDLAFDQSFHQLEAGEEHQYVIDFNNAFTLIGLLLIKHPDIQQRLRVELETIPQGYTGADLSSLPFLDAVLKETLRIYPPALSAMPRVVPSSGAKIKGVHYPAHTVIAAQPYMIHRDSVLFPDPEMFDPDR
ncbi:hypothetical protein NM208_g3730 [Fusarium decemcellulare]|uniref:Uncharacterized protein n=1 Tax=Fusarium decemcellulare TaxID=57161 RepID=A0ACC1SN90_9HYPO|nr:hypothetical protein NM208_g3730 [Fusarium decemcellulare]